MRYSLHSYYYTVQYYKLAREGDKIYSTCTAAQFCTANPRLQSSRQPSPRRVVTTVATPLRVGAQGSWLNQYSSVYLSASVKHCLTCPRLGNSSSGTADRSTNDGKKMTINQRQGKAINDQGVAVSVVTASRLPLPQVRVLWQKWQKKTIPHRNIWRRKDNSFLDSLQFIMG